MLTYRPIKKLYSIIIVNMWFNWDSKSVFPIIKLIANLETSLWAMSHTETGRELDLTYRLHLADSSFKQNII